jgi:hypothetical protein
MKDWLSIKAIPRLLFIKKNYVFIAYNGILKKKKNHNFGKCYSWKVMTHKIKMIGNFELCDGFYNCLLCVIKVQHFSKFVTYPKGCFSWPIIIFLAHYDFIFLLKMLEEFHHFCQLSVMYWCGLVFTVQMCRSCLSTFLMHLNAIHVSQLTSISKYVYDCK